MFGWGRAAAGGAVSGTILNPLAVIAYALLKNEDARTSERLRASSGAAILAGVAIVIAVLGTAPKDPALGFHRVYITLAGLFSLAMLVWLVAYPRHSRDR